MEEFSTYWKIWSETLGAIHSTKIPTGPTGKIGPPQKVDPFFRNFSGWTEPIHWVLDRNFRTFWLNGSRPLFTHDRSIFSLCSHGTFERLGLEICVRLRWFRVNGTAIRTNFDRPVPCEKRNVVSLSSKKESVWRLGLNSIFFENRWLLVEVWQLIYSEWILWSAVVTNFARFNWEKNAFYIARE